MLFVGRAGSREEVAEAQRRRAHPRGEERDLFELRERVAPKTHLDDEWQTGGAAAREGAHETDERAFAAPAVVRLACRAVETERDVRDRFAVRAHGGPDALEVPAVCDEAALEALFAH